MPIKIQANELNEILNIERNALYVIGGDFNAQHSIWNSQIISTNGTAIHEWYMSNKYFYDITLYASEEPICKRSMNGSHIDFGFIPTEIEMINIVVENKTSKRTILGPCSNNNANLDPTGRKKNICSSKTTRKQTGRNFRHLSNRKSVK